VVRLLPFLSSRTGLLTTSMEHRCCSRDIDGASMPFAGAASGGGRELWCG
jgi:hypothetical protein